MKHTQDRLTNRIVLQIELIKAVERIAVLDSTMGVKMGSDRRRKEEEENGHGKSVVLRELNG